MKYIVLILALMIPCGLSAQQIYIANEDDMVLAYGKWVGPIEQKNGSDIDPTYTYTWEFVTDGPNITVNGYGYVNRKRVTQQQVPKELLGAVTKLIAAETRIRQGHKTNTITAVADSLVQEGVTVDMRSDGVTIKVDNLPELEIIFPDVDATYPPQRKTLEQANQEIINEFLVKIKEGNIVVFGKKYRYFVPAKLRAEFIAEVDKIRIGEKSTSRIGVFQDQRVITDITTH